MKRDIELIRKILREVEKKQEPKGWINPEVDGYSEVEVSYHIKLLAEAGYLEAEDLSTKNSFEWVAKGLTPEGHHFLEGMENATLWSKMKKHFGSGIKTVSLELIKIYLTRDTQ